MADWGAVGLAALWGALGGLTLDIIQDGTLDLPRRDRQRLYLGFLTDIVAGAAGGIVALMTTADPAGGVTPQLLGQLLSGSGVSALWKAMGAARGRASSAKP